MEKRNNFPWQRFKQNMPSAKSCSLVLVSFEKQTSQSIKILHFISLKQQQSINVKLNKKERTF